MTSTRPLASVSKSVGIKVLPAGIVLKTLFEIAYIYHVSPSFSYSGLVLSINYQKLAESYLVVFVMFLVASWRENTPSTMILIFGLFTGIVPLASIYALQDRSSVFFYMAVASYLMSFVVTALPRIKLAYLRIDSGILLGLCVTFVVSVISLMILQGAYRHFTLDLFSIYRYRGELGELIFIGPFKYISHWAPAVFNITLLVWSIHYHNKTLMVLAILLQIFMFGCILEKAILFNFPFVILTYYIIRGRGDIVALGWLICCIVALGMLEVLVLHQGNITTLITRRVMTIPAYFANEYYELFREIGHVYWTNGLLGALYPYPFADDPPRLVGEAALGSRNTWANNGMFGMGFMEAGFFGMFFYGVLYGFWLYLIDCIAVQRVPVQVAVAMVIVPTGAVATDSDLLTGLLTHGGIAATLMLWLWAGIMPEQARIRRQGMRLAANLSGRIER
jgi:hypothetical protein